MKAFRIFIAGFLIALAAGLIAPASLRAQDDTTLETTTPDATAPDANTPDTTAQDDSNPSFDYFYDALQPYGQWVQVEGYGPCWQPNAAQDPNWQPYTDGYWAYTDAGWTWVSYENFGWITYHYGRWTQIQDAGWVWVPDYQWAPAWVSWRVTRNFNAPAAAAFIGWAPLPPECQFNPATGVGFWVDAKYDIGPGCYNFCRVSDFGAPVLGPVIIDHSKNSFIINSTANITNITTNNNIVFNGGPSFAALSKRVSHPIPTLQLVRQTDPGIFRKNGAKGVLALPKGNQLIVAAPKIVAPRQPFKPAKVARVFDKPVITRGWAGVDPKQKLQLQAAIKAQNKGLKITPAKPVTAEQLSVIPKGNAPVPPAGQKGTPAPGKNLKPAIVTARPTPPETGKTSPTPPDEKQRPRPPLTPFNPNASGTQPPKGNTPPPKPTAQPNEAAIAGQRKLEEEKAQAAAAAEAAAAARRQQQAQTPRPVPPPQPIFPGKGGKPTPTATPTPGH